VRSLIFTISLTAFIVMLGMSIISPLLPIFAEELGATGIWIGIIFSAYSFSRLIFLPIAGRVSDIYGRRVIVLTGLLVYSVVTMLYAIANSPELLSLIRLLHGVTSAMIIPVTMALVAEVSPVRKEGYFMGMFNRALFLGMASGPFLGGIIAELVGLRLTFLFIGLIGFFTLFLVFLTFPETVGRTDKKRTTKVNPRVWTAFLYRFLNSMGRGSILSFFPIYLGLAGFSISVIGFLISFNLFISALIQPVAGRLSDRIGVSIPVTTSSLIGAGVLFMIPRVHDLSALIFLSFFLGVTSAMSIPAVGSIIAVEGKHGGMGQLMGTLSASKSLGRIMGPLISGIVFDVYGGGFSGIVMAFTIASLIAILSAVVFFVGMYAFKHNLTEDLDAGEIS